MWQYNWLISCRQRFGVFSKGSSILQQFGENELFYWLNVHCWFTPVDLDRLFCVEPINSEVRAINEKGGICSVICLFGNLWLSGTQYPHSQIAVLTSMFLVQQPEEGTEEWKLLEACRNPKSWVPASWIHVLENKIAFAQTLRILEDPVSAAKWHFFAVSEIFLTLIWISWDWSRGNTVLRWVNSTLAACYLNCFNGDTSDN